MDLTIKSHFANGAAFDPRARLIRLLPQRAPRAEMPPWRLRRVLSFVDSHIADPLRLEDLAGAAGLSRMHFAAQFRAATGYRPHSYVLHRRIEEAKTLIGQSEMTMVQVALDVGFQSQAHFCTVFKRLTGVTPTRWRRRPVAGSAEHPPMMLVAA